MVACIDTKELEKVAGAALKLHRMSSCVPAENNGEAKYNFATNHQIVLIEGLDEIPASAVVGC
jgi:hypothetical protein